MREFTSQRAPDNSAVGGQTHVSTSPRIARTGVGRLTKRDKVPCHMGAAGSPSPSGASWPC